MERHFFSRWTSLCSFITDEATQTRNGALRGFLADEGCSARDAEPAVAALGKMRDNRSTGEEDVRADSLPGATDEAGTCAAVELTVRWQDDFKRTVPYSSLPISRISIFVNLMLSSSVNTGSHRPRSHIAPVRSGGRYSLDMRCQVFSRPIMGSLPQPAKMLPRPTAHISQLKRYRVLRSHKSLRLSDKSDGVTLVVPDDR